MILNHDDIIKAVCEEHSIIINPFDSTNVGPNSYDVTLNKTLKAYNFNSERPELKGFRILDSKSENSTTNIEIPDDGLVLLPNTLYLGSTNETATSDKYVPMFEGRSSIGRLGISTHITAGFGDVGWGYVKGECQYPTWTLEISVIHPVIVYPNMRIGQVYFLKTLTEPKFMYQGKYSLQKEAQASMSFKDKEFNR